jgi:ATP-binding protein involved in chromosome partitioning
MASRDDVMQALATVQEPDLNSDLVSLELVRHIQLDGDRVVLKVALTTPATPHKAAIEHAIRAAVGALPGVAEVELTLAADPPVGIGRLRGVRHVIGVGAGKGGVGKSTVAVNLAVSLAQAGARVGLLDADVYGPSVPIMLGLRGTKPGVNAERQIIPAEAHGVRCVSMGFLVSEEQAVAWRGPMVGRAVQQFIDEVAWGELDYLVVDLPPGTGDIILSLCQTLPLSGAVVVTTPQDVAFADVLRAVRMFHMLKVEVLGLVENMSFFRAPDTGKAYEIFGPSHAERHCSNHELPLLGKLPMDMMVSPYADAGRPIAAAEPQSEQGRLYAQIAGKLASTLAVQAWRDKPKDAVGQGFFGPRG